MTLLSIYLRLALGVCGLGVAIAAFRTLRAMHVPDGWSLRLSRALLALTVLLALIPVARRDIGPFPSAKVWAAPSMRSADRITTIPVVSVGAADRALPLLPLQKIWWGLFLLGIAVAIYRIGRNVFFLRRLRAESIPFRTLGRVEVRASSSASLPLSYWLPSASVVIVPDYLLGHPQDLSLAIRHEIQHHRQGDTLWLYVLETMNSLLFWNPLAWFFSRNVCEIQEFACDEALVLRKRVSARAYGGCLLRVAESMHEARGRQFGTACAAADSSASTLKRRIIHMLIEKKKTRVAIAAAWLGTILSLTCVVTAWAAQFGVQDRRISRSQVQEAVASYSDSEFPITINEHVLKALNHYAGTPDGREYIQNSLARLENYRALVDKKLNDYHMPEELMALPIMESGYQNLAQASTSAKSAGVWQFIPSTARNFGLIVDAKVDERLNVEKETDAAMRYLGGLNLRFRDWELAILSYNAGEHRVQKGIDQTGQRNAWHLINSGFDGDNGYLAKVIASVILMKSPQLLQ